MFVEINEWDMKRIFREWDRDYYSTNGCRALLDYYDELFPNTEFNPVEVCCNCSEYGDEYCSLDFNDLINDYGYLYTVDEYNEDHVGFDKDDYIKNLIEVLERYTTVLPVINGNYIVFTF